MKTAKEFFAGLYCHSPVPVIVFGEDGIQPICTAGPLEALMKRLFLNSTDLLFPPELWRAAPGCLDSFIGFTVSKKFFAATLLFSSIAYPYNGEVYLVVTVLEDRGPEHDEKGLYKILQNCRGKLNTYLDMIYGHAELLGAKHRSFGPISTGVRRIMRMSDHLERLLEGDDPEHYQVPIDAGAFTANCIAAAKEILPDAAITVEPYDEKMFVSIMPENTELVLTAMLSNGLRYCKSEVVVRVSRREDGKVLITVQDDGAGMVDPDRLSEWGYRVADSQGVEGLGFSLVVARKLLARQGATLEYERKGAHTLFHIIMDEVKDPRIGRLAEWKPESQLNRLSQMRIELSDYYDQTEE
ncbi:MAG: HAMP domain-containing histidine kinase [Clostridia bacterium]|nr:HAMP domain-containing histidine kinase [Clostridia bacterium]